MSSLKHKDKQPQNFDNYILLKIILSFYQVNFPTSTRSPSTCHFNVTLNVVH